MLKFPMDGAARGKLGMAGVGGALRNNLREALAMFSKHVGIMESNKVEVVAIFRSVPFFLFLFSW